MRRLKVIVAWRGENIKMNLLIVCKLKTAKYIHSWPSSTSGPSNDIFEIRIGSPRVLSHFTQKFLSGEAMSDGRYKFYVTRKKGREIRVLTKMLNGFYVSFNEYVGRLFLGHLYHIVFICGKTRWRESRWIKI